MNKCFADLNQNKYIKILSSEKRAQREIHGARVFCAFAQTVSVELVDTRTVVMEKATGYISVLESDSDLNLKIIGLFLKIKNNFKSQTDERFSVLTYVEDLAQKYADSQIITRHLGEIRRAIKGVNLFPVHGDLQKQNILITDKQICLIDFEHFMYAPQEFELVNSFFHSDDNCLDVCELVPRLINLEIVDISLFGHMLLLYALKEFDQGLDFKTAMTKYRRGKRLFESILKNKTFVSQKISSSRIVQESNLASCYI